MYKICPSCETKNPINEMLCINCMADISSVSIYKDIDNISTNEELTDEKIETNQNFNINQEENKLELVLVENQELKIEIVNNAIIGRYHLGKEIFQKLPNPKLISREHTNIFFKNNKWYIRDLNSTNGTYLLIKNQNTNDEVNEIKLEPYKDYEISKGMILSIAKLINFYIEI
jgi:pSer/pThr/pTyr-binding forkhead associated (FHA) protein